MTHPTVSVVMRTKDRPVLLTRAIADVAAQRFEDWELIIVNDGGERAPVDRLMREHEAALKGRGRVIHNETSRGMEHASNQAIEASSGEFICVHDDDDTWAPTFLERTIACLRENPNYGAVAVRTEIVLERLSATGVEEIGREPAWPEIHQFSLSELMHQNIAVPIGCLYRASVIADLGGFRDDLPVVGDWEFHLRLAVAYDVAYLDGAPLAFWHQRRTQGGALGNSVFAGADKHAYFDLKVRDEYLRDYARDHGVGALLFIAAMGRGGGMGQPETAFSFALRQARRGLYFVRSTRQDASLDGSSPLSHAARRIGRKLRRR
ncbi:glycosyltransferase family 2 protein [Nanchangia anserum]|uniref:Glycosyltransferase family 2 protein n=1 Tax=Nanchangia anserum TaxID=2692125 RepID=A0A8I0KQK3_9ACTO|nr:glycosyltransferase family 2 protein [Nanchangia anserum]MBD3690080.1 glycosyltransferase family 2 protein [Nanchangia anserum]QOX82128.1 glycosyltransferase family 2 protein [Nanchangia anserum]